MSTVQIANAADASPHPPSDGLPRAAPTAKGVSPRRVAALLDDAAAQGIELDSFMLWRDGAVVAEGWWWPYRSDRVHMMHSATKSFLSAAVGFAVAEGRIRLADRVAGFFPDRIGPTVDGNLARMTVEDLLTQTSGHAQGMSGGKWRGISTSWIDEFLKIPVTHVPGTRFTYSSATSFMLSAIISRATGMTAHAYLTPRLLEPLGIADLRWDVGPEGINPGGNGISCRTADLLKLAILHVQGGEWNGRQILPPEWVAAATTPQRGNQHGYHWWTGPGGSFHAYGVFGQFAWAYPREKGVLAVTAAVPGHEEALRALADRHLPAIFGGGTEDEEREEGPLISRCERLRLLPPLAPTSSELAGRVSDATFLADRNEDGVAYVRIRFDGDRASFRLGDARGEHLVEVGLTEWIESDTTMTGARLHHGYEPASLRVIAGGRWRDPATFEMTWQFVETSFRDTVALHFAEDAMRLERSVNVNTFPTTRPPIHATRTEVPADMPHAALLALALAAQGVPPATDQAPPARYSTTTTTIGELLDTPATRAVLEADAPFVVHHPRIDEGRLYTLADIVQYAPELTPAVLARIDADLAKVERPASAKAP